MNFPTNDISTERKEGAITVGEEDLQPVPPVDDTLFNYLIRYWSHPKPGTTQYPINDCFGNSLSYTCWAKNLDEAEFMARQDKGRNIRFHSVTQIAKESDILKK